ncbi:hypothetical protein BVX97_03765, partial [bacterium E08(2017)]
EYIPAVANFILLKTGNGVEVFKKLQEKGVIVRPMAGYKLPDYIRITVGEEDQNRKFINALQEVLS